MTTIPSDSRKKKKIVAIWLLVGVFMIIVQVFLGGVTRLTDSGLSITEWDPIMGAIPPLNHHDWMEAFAGYQQIAQYQQINFDFTLSDFKFIFYWEWFHRLWARSLGVVFAIPFVYFLIKGYFTRKMIFPLVMLFVLGGLQGFIGWYMVQSGLAGSELLRVSHIRLSIHFIAALVLLIYAFWFALQLLVPKRKKIFAPKLKYYFAGVTVLLVIQLFYGAFMAGLRAAPVVPTWPKMSGEWIPSGMWANSWINNAVNVQFIHRGIAYLLFFLILFGAVKVIRLGVRQKSGLLKNVGKWPAVFVILQVILGIFTVVSALKIVPRKFGIYEILAESHQLIGMGLLMSMVMVLFLLKRQRSY